MSGNEVWVRLIPGWPGSVIHTEVGLPEKSQTKMRFKHIPWHNRSIQQPSTRWGGSLVSRSLLAGLVCMAAMVLVSGCGSGKVKLQEPSDEGLPAEAVAVRVAFEDASPSYKHPVGEVLNLVKVGSQNPQAYAEAIPQLQRLANNPNISAEQKQALQTLMQKLRTDLSTGSRP